jgi:hypothetical protein
LVDGWNQAVMLQGFSLNSNPTPQKKKKKKKRRKKEEEEEEEGIIGLPSFILEFFLNLHPSSLNLCVLSNDVLTYNLAFCVLYKCLLIYMLCPYISFFSFKSLFFYSICFPAPHMM